MEPEQEGLAMTEPSRSSVMSRTDIGNPVRGVLGARVAAAVVGPHQGAVEGHEQFNPLDRLVRGPKKNKWRWRY